MDPRSLKEGNYFYDGGAIRRYSKVQFCDEALRLDFRNSTSAINIAEIDLVKLGFNKVVSDSGQFTDGYWCKLITYPVAEIYVWQEEDGNFFARYYIGATSGVKRKVTCLHNLQNYFTRYGCQDLDSKIDKIHRGDPHLTSIFTQY